ncbi:MAG: VOC family protein [Synechococcus sp.]|jgi:catechol 2,3-dioxygenase-like lactoylglutathione lyase family enzyme|uniref:VOC family protein n=1 Tax=Synechococcus sp. BMK-MC-1 TaxID=1442551 RepID=UPI0016458B8C|nr:VOC family protein [Synechococcus sp. BMK-MC-1]
MPVVERLGHVAIRVEDMDRAVAFYSQLGMEMVWNADDWCYMEAAKSRDGLALLGPNYKAAGPHFAFHFRDRAEVDAVHAQLKAAGVAVGAVHDHRDGTASFYLRDPEGNWLEMLYEPPGGIPSNQPGATEAD